MTTIRKPTRKQIMFVNEYVHSNNATQAAISAGYKSDNAHTVAAQLLLKPQVQELLSKNIKDKAKASHVTYDWKVGKLEQIIEVCMSNQPTNTTNAIKAIEVLNAMQGHNSESKSVHINIDTTIERLAQARLQYKEY